MGHITIHDTIGAAASTVFAYVDDYRNTTKYMKDLVKWKPTGKTTHGKGAQFEVGMKAGPTTLSSVVDITTWTENSAIGWVSRQGFKQTGQWSFKAKGDKTDVTFDMDYEFGGGIAGKMLGRVAEPIVRSNLGQSVKALKAHTERLAAKPAATKAAATKPAVTPKAAKPRSKRAGTKR